MKTIQLTQGKVALVDDEDFDRLNQFKWFAHEEPKGSGRFYAIRNQKTETGRKGVKMHREVLGLRQGDMDVDHWDRDTLNNRKQNLRKATDAQTVMNRIGWSKLGFKGVHVNPRCKLKPFAARIRIRGVDKHLGYFATAVDAAKAYNQKAIELFGEFARLNPV